MVQSKAYSRIKCFLILLPVVCLILFNITIFSSCGLDTFYYVEAPEQNGDKPGIDNPEAGKQIFQFNTKEMLGSSGFSITGTDVYYKIYSNKEDWKKEKDDLVGLADNNSVNAADKLTGISSSGYGYNYKQLRIKDSLENVLVPYSGGNKHVEIRLTDYYNMPEYSASVKVNGSRLGTGIPVRDNGKSFNFGRENGKNIPSIDDEDVKVGGNALPADNKWIVCLFAVARGHDAAYTNYYSNITYLGSVTIDGNSHDN